jgi:hypothetical protein
MPLAAEQTGRSARGRFHRRWADDDSVTETSLVAPLSTLRFESARDLRPALRPGTGRDPRSTQRGVALLACCI